MKDPHERKFGAHAFVGSLGFGLKEDVSFNHIFWTISGSFAPPGIPGLAAALQEGARWPLASHALLALF